MKSPNKQDWQMLTQLALQYAAEMLDNSCGTTPKCIRHCAPDAVLQWQHLRDRAIEAYRSDHIFQEARFIESKLTSISERNAVIANRGVLLCYGTRSETGTDFAETFLFRLWLSCHCFPCPSTSTKENHSKGGKKAFIQPCPLPFQLQITDFDYETVA
jgi:hypothetical protein